ncbi:MAG: metal ABC transporter substrate-binding protein [Actinomycetota bacterium]|nr:metal ABC transporter substrate-binding protein [Actinomycetota bacterium]
MPGRAFRPLLALGAALAVPVASLASCSAGGGSSSSASGGPGTLRVVTSFYPIEFAVQQVGGSHVSVRSLTKAGTEPHDLELSPKDVAGVADAGLVVYAGGFQPAVDTAVAQEGAAHAFDVAPAAHLDLAAPAEGDDPKADAVAGGAATTSPAPDSAKDPHFWLDPERYAAVANAIAGRLAEADPPHAADYTANAARFADSLRGLDGELKAGLATCTNRDLVTSHAAFGYLSQRYGLTQVAIAGLSPDVEPSGARLAEIATFVKANHVSTIYAETLVEPAFAQTVSRSTGATVATLDPIEGLTSESAGRDYLEVMRSNLATLRTGQGCS